MYDHYLSPTAEEPVNIDNLARSKAKIEAADADVNSFLDAEHQVWDRIFSFDSFSFLLIFSFVILSLPCLSILSMTQLL